MVKDALNVARRQCSARIQVKFKETVAFLVMKNLPLWTVPEMEGNVTCLNGCNGRQALIVMGQFDVIDFGRIQRLHTDIVYDAANHFLCDMLFIRLGAPSSFYTEKQVMMLDLFKFPSIFLCERLHRPIIPRLLCHLS